MKKFFILLLLPLLMFSLVLTAPAALEEIYDVDTSRVDPNFSYNSSWDADFIYELKNASPNAIVAYDGATGETTIFEFSTQPYSYPTETEPYIPEGMTKICD